MRRLCSEANENQKTDLLCLYMECPHFCQYYTYKQIDGLVIIWSQVQILQGKAHKTFNIKDLQSLYFWQK